MTTMQHVSDVESRKQMLIDMMGQYVTRDFVNWLEEKGFFTAPASHAYHGSYPGGLFDHSMGVMLSLLELTEANGLNWQHQRSPYIVGMFHDLCKIDIYVMDMDGTYDFDPNADSRHGEKSVDLLSQFYELTEEEKRCVRWHMGAFDQRENWNQYSGSVKEYPNVLWTHTADMIAAHVKGI